MTPQTNASFQRVLSKLSEMGDLAKRTASVQPVYQQFIQRFPVNRLRSLTLDEYCVGKGEGESFCRWIERGLEPVLGRYMPGTSRGHLLYFFKNGTVYKNRHLKALSDQDALAYTLRVQATVAEADASQDLRWIDDDAQIYQRAEVQPRVTMGHGRKLRLLAAYHPDVVLPFSSTDHLGHFLEVLGCPPKDILARRRPVARMLQMHEYFELARQSCPGLTPWGFMLALYSPDLGLAPVKESNEDTSDDADLDDIVPTPPADAMPPLNQILFGPPGSGKTYSTIDHTLAILDPALLKQHVGQATPEARAALKHRYDELKDARRVRFVTFHQSFSYEDFVEGIRASTPDEEDDSGQAISYAVKPGVFLALCNDARHNRQFDASLGVREGAKVWKLSIEEASGSGDTRAYCLANGEARIGWSQTGDLNTADLDDPTLNLGSNERHALRAFGHQITQGDVVVCLASRTTIGAVGVVTGDYEYTPTVPAGVRDDYVHRLPVQWLAQGLNFNILDLNDGFQLTLKAVYHLQRIQWPDLMQALTQAGFSLASVQPAMPAAAEPYVLVIDEINRGNVSRVFGELITLIEPSKRAGADEALEAVLPYSQKPFSVPQNVYLIGTMNTADRSLAGLDVALRRRFVFKEMPPRPDLLSKVVVDGVNLGQLLAVLNQRIEALLDREHCLGHAYFMPLVQDPTMVKLAEIFRHQVLPLLQEYFFEDWQRIQWVFNDHRKPAASYQFIRAQPLNTLQLFGDGVNVSHRSQTWVINEEAFLRVQSYLGVVDHNEAT